jgi:hypothetical protein
MNKTFKNLAIGQRFEFTSGLDFSKGKVFTKVSPRQYKHTGFSNESKDNVRGLTYKIGSVKCEVIAK